MNDNWILCVCDVRNKKKYLLKLLNLKINVHVTLIVSKCCQIRFGVINKEDSNLSEKVVWNYMKTSHSFFKSVFENDQKLGQYTGIELKYKVFTHFVNIVFWIQLSVIWEYRFSYIWIYNL